MIKFSRIKINTLDRVKHIPTVHVSLSLTADVLTTTPLTGSFKLLSVCLTPLEASHVIKHHKFQSVAQCWIISSLVFNVPTRQRDEASVHVIFNTHRFIMNRLLVINNLMMTTIFPHDLSVSCGLYNKYLQIQSSETKFACLFRQSFYISQRN